jgi:small-conductance mechanosensitive channel
VIDPFIYLAVATCLVAVAFAAPVRQLNWPLWLRAGWAVGIFVALAFILVHLVGSPLRPVFGEQGPGQVFWEKLVVACWWFLGARGIIALVRFTMVLEQRPRETQILTDLIAGAVYIAALLAIVNFVFHVPVGGLVATSGIIAIGLGLALQSTLSDVFSGIAVGVERPYRAGDLIWVEGGIEGRVTLVTWRSTHIATDLNNIAIVPNSVIAKARLINRSRPTMMRGDTIEVRLDPSVAPERCIAVLQEAVSTACRHLLTAPAPSIYCGGLNGDGCLYSVSFSVADSGHLAAARSELLVEIHRHLRYNDIGFAIHGSANVVRAPAATLPQLLAQSDLFGVLDEAGRNELAPHFSEMTLEQGEPLIKQGQEPDALYIIAAGVAEVTVSDGTTSRVVRHIRPGESLGAIGLITGMPYAATAIAETRMTVFKLDREALAAAIEAEPRLAHGLEGLAKRSQAALRRDAATFADTKHAQPDMFLTGLRNFVQLLKSRESP